jgi:microsomal epoxide hydrolase
MTISPLHIEVSESVLTDLAVRLVATRLPHDKTDDWSAGTNPTYLAQLVDYWRHDFDWRAQERMLARFPHFTSERHETLHFIHERGHGPAPLPLVLTHGYPDSFTRFLKLIPLLVDPAAHGGDPRDAFDVVVPSLPGFAFSSRPRNDQALFHIADRWHELMTVELGYSRYGAHGGDWGSLVSEHLGRNHHGAVVGMHLTDVPFWHGFRRPRDLDTDERAYLADMDEFQRLEGLYAMLQGTRPQTLADGLSDSPAGLLAWLLQFFERWSDCDGNIERAFSRDELLTNAMLYWATNTIGSSFRLYFDVAHAGAPRWILEAIKQWVGGTKVPAGFAIFPHDILRPPRKWAERFFRVTHWTEMPRGGHFAALEQPDLLAEDIRAFFRPLR